MTIIEIRKALRESSDVHLRGLSYSLTDGQLYFLRKAFEEGRDPRDPPPS